MDNSRSETSARRIPSPFRTNLRELCDRRHAARQRSEDPWAVVIADIHGCWHTLQNLLNLVGKVADQAGRSPFIISVGDIHDKGGIKFGTPGFDHTSYGSVRVLRWALEEQVEGRLELVDSNHGLRLVEYLRDERDLNDGSPTQLTAMELRAQYDAGSLVSEVTDLLASAPPYILRSSPRGEYLVAHAAFTTRFLGLNSLNRNEYRYVIGHNQPFRWTGQQTLITGHVTCQAPTRSTFHGDDSAPYGDLIRLNTGVESGGGLAAYIQDLDRFLWVPTSRYDVASPVHAPRLDM